MKIAQRFTTILAGCLMCLMAGCAPTAHREGTGEYIDDALITSKVKAAFAADPTVKATEVQVETFKGTVQLSGFVSSRESAQRAVQIARQVKGVSEVRNNTVLK
ncbi:BON domain-containing protein [Massilia sp. Dwa41.01b]|uniref:BON domain-containing protein n=1 Tax=unclassified Massilia TaxID=2609279 RepID=UPI00160008CD|nr:MULTISPECIES: BON domain-containing protein [unclassified Massilia]QNA90788.1 BON domain-containing protein [Massilia sp. Dwa41.01b]QNA98024.1 BON domain-containing protein [Massilia sp. Se16.2.3]